MLEKNLKRHLTTAHSNSTITSMCCYLEAGLYMVCKNATGGIRYPVHVQKIIHSSEKLSVDYGDI